MGALLYAPFLLAHDTVLPHHKEDFEELAERRNLVLIITGGFVLFLASVVIYAFRHSDDDRPSDLRKEQERLKRLTLNAAQAAIGSPETSELARMRVAVRAYSDAVQLPPPSVEEPSDRPFQIGNDQLSVGVKPDGSLEITATTAYAGARIVASRDGSMSSSVFAVYR